MVGFSVLNGCAVFALKHALALAHAISLRAPGTEALSELGFRISAVRAELLWGVAWCPGRDGESPRRAGCSLLDLPRSREGADLPHRRLGYLCC
jgi:hypothetical protein